MKRVLSLLLAFTLLFSLSTFTQTSAVAASKSYAQDKLIELQKTTGYISGSTAVVTGNCYLFVAKVCEKLYGVTYNGEGLYGNYKSHHYSGNYYTVSTFETSSRTPTNTDVENIISFFINNATSGDIVHYGAYSQSVSKTHTIMIQSVSTEKMEIYHSNYNVAQHSSSDCHVDTIYWDSFRKNPTQTIKNSDGTLYSFNSLFYNTMKIGGLGITINRYKNYEDKYYLVKAVVPTVKVSRTSPTSMDIKWDKIEGADKYKVQYKKSGDSSYKTLTENCKKLKYSINNLELGKKYYFRVAAFFGTKFMDYSKAVSKTALPPTLTKLNFSIESLGLNLKWNALNDITGVRIYKSDSSNGTFSKIKTITDKTVESYLDKKIAYGKRYYYKIERYIKSGSNEYSTTSKAISGKYLLSSPTITFKNNSATSVELTFNASGKNDFFNYYLTDQNAKTVVSLSKTVENSITLKDLTPGEKYNFSCRQSTPVGSGEYTTLTFTAIPKRERISSVSQTSKGIKISYTTCNDVDGYTVYRCASQFGTYKAVATVDDSEIASVTDSDIEYNKEYFYKVRSFVKKGSDKVFSEYSDASNDIKIKLSVPQNLVLNRTTPTSMTLKWEEVKNADRYIVEYKKEGGNWIELSSTKSTKKLKEKLIVGKTYYFRVKAGNKIGWGNFSSGISKQMLPPTPSAPELKNKEGGIRVYWKPIDGVTGYKILKATSKGGTYKVVKTITNPKATCWTDKNVQNNKTYYYKTARYVKKNKTFYLSPKSKSSHIKCVK
ncbi:MAG: fibronectin type III domain-containing protein [Eubacterium sp.]|nr:fibronectin type III domain-containing protein [Eubacterium sp.]